MIPWLNLIVNTITILVTFLIAVFVLRQRLSYFRNVGKFVVSSLAGFILFVGLHNYKYLTGTYPTAIDISLVSWIALNVGFLVASLSKYPESSSIKKRFESFIKKPDPSISIYSVLLITWSILAWVFSPFTMQPATELITGITFLKSIYEPWFLGYTAIVLVVVFLYPSLTLFRLSRQATDVKVKGSLKTLSVCWGILSLNTFHFHIAAPTLGIDACSLGFLIDLSTLLFVAYAFKEATILAKVFQVVRKPTIRVSEGEHVLLLYSSQTDKMRVFLPYVQAGLMEGDRVVYVHPDEEESMIRKRLTEYGVNVEKHEKDGSLRLITLSKAYLPDGTFNKDHLIRFWKEFKAETLKKRYKHQRDLFDLGDLSFMKGEVETYIQYLREGQKQILDPFLLELRAINKEHVNEKTIQEFIRSTHPRSTELLEHMDIFSKTLGLSHEEVVGRKILFEFDPRSKYERAVEDFITEALARVKTVIVVTHKGSALYSTLTEDTCLFRAVKVFCLTPRVSAPTVGASDNELLVPLNPPLILDAFDKTLKAYPYSGVAIVFDTLSYLMQSVGFEKTYSFVQYATDMLASTNATVLFLLNSGAHDPKMTFSLRGLLSDQVSYTEKGIEVVRLTKIRPEDKWRESLVVASYEEQTA